MPMGSPYPPSKDKVTANAWMCVSGLKLKALEKDITVEETFSHNDPSCRKETCPNILLSERLISPLLRSLSLLLLLSLCFPSFLFSLLLPSLPFPSLCFSSFSCLLFLLYPSLLLPSLLSFLPPSPFPSLPCSFSFSTFFLAFFWNYKYLLIPPVPNFRCSRVGCETRCSSHYWTECGVWGWVLQEAN